MAPPEETIQDSPIGFEEAVAYALHRDMRRLVIIYVVGSLLIPLGFTWMFDPPFIPAIGLLLGLVVTIAGAVLLFGGLIGAVFKLVTDANRLANARQTTEEKRSVPGSE